MAYRITISALMGPSRVTTNSISPSPHRTCQACLDIAAWLNDPQNVLDGLEGFFSVTENIASGIDSIEIPLISGGPFDSLAAEIRKLETLVLGDKTDDTYENRLGKVPARCDRERKQHVGCNPRCHS